MAQGGFGRPEARDKLMIGFLPRTEAVFQYKHCSATGWLYWLYKGGCRGGLLFLVAARQYLPNLSIVISGVRRRHQGDLLCILSRLDYLESLGVDAVWL